MLERRLDARTPAPLLVNKYVDGQPYFCHVSDISWSGARLVRTVEPDLPQQVFPLEVGLPGGVIWIWTRHVWTRGRQQAVRIIGMDRGDEELFSRYLRGDN